MERIKFGIATVLVALLIAAMSMPLTVLAGDPAVHVHERHASDDEDQISDRLGKEGGEASLFRPFGKTDGEVMGHFVFFEYEDSDGTITNYQMFDGEDMVTVFDGVAITGLSNGDITVTGPLFQPMGETQGVLIRNNPTALLQVISASEEDEIVSMFSENWEIADETVDDVSVVNVTLKDRTNGSILECNGAMFQLLDEDNRTLSGVLVEFYGGGGLQFRAVPALGSAG